MSMSAITCLFFMCNYCRLKTTCAALPKSAIVRKWSNIFVGTIFMVVNCYHELFAPG